MMLKETYRGKKVLVTGHTGFKGSWLSLYLSMLGADVIGYAKRSETMPNLHDVLKMNEIIFDGRYELRDKWDLFEVVCDGSPDFIFHLAAQPLVRESYKNPYYTIETNVMGTLNLLEAVRIANNKCVVINVTSDKCYANGDHVNHSFTETDAMGGNDPYSASKGMSELLTNSYRESFFNPNKYDKTHRVSLASARAGNVIGGGDWSQDRLIPDVVRALANKDSVEIRNPNSTRPWQHVLDCITGYLMLGESMYKDPTSFCEGWNFGPARYSKEISVGQILSKAQKCWGVDYGHELDTDVNSFAEANYLTLSTTKAKTRLGWEPLYDTDKAILETIEWYKAFYSNDTDMLQFTKNRIEDYRLGK